LIPEQIAAARLRRSGLVEQLGDAAEVARKLVGIQSQFLPASGLSIAGRTNGPFSGSLLDRLLNEERRLVRLWGQRNTVHVYDAQDWAMVVAASRAIPTYRTSLCKRLGEPEEAMEAALDRIADLLLAGGRLTRADLVEADPSLEPWLSFGNIPIIDLVRRGLACHAGVEGGQSYFAHREAWLPAFDGVVPETDAAGMRLAVRYFAGYGPATVQDFAFWLGAKVGDARRWVEGAGSELEEIRVGGESWVDVVDAPTAARSGREELPGARLLYRFDPLLLAHRDKAWLVDEDRYKAVWRKAGYVEAVVLIGGRISGTWTYDRSARGVGITLAPFRRLTRAERSALAEDAETVARYFEVELDSVDVA